MEKHKYYVREILEISCGALGIFYFQYLASYSNLLHDDSSGQHDTLDQFDSVCLLQLRSSKKAPPQNRLSASKQVHGVADCQCSSAVIWHIIRTMCSYCSEEPSGRPQWQNRQNWTERPCIEILKILTMTEHKIMSKKNIFTHPNQMRFPRVWAKCQCLRFSSEKTTDILSPTGYKMTHQDVSCDEAAWSQFPWLRKECQRQPYYFVY